MVSVGLTINDQLFFLSRKLSFPVIFLQIVVLQETGSSLSLFRFPSLYLCPIVSLCLKANRFFSASLSYKSFFASRFLFNKIFTVHSDAKTFKPKKLFLNTVLQHLWIISLTMENTLRTFIQKGHWGLIRKYRR
jgi:hypothetical protein